MRDAGTAGDRAQRETGEAFLLEEIDPGLDEPIGQGHGAIVSCPDWGTITDVTAGSASSHYRVGSPAAF
ncbi:hypothetical protein GCM10009742_19640 [Kribbella karoonensis]|uniref:Uncharacterized protein n=1 Tax=Kribbella karoonensis TaxID=324851 RepID=A0ABN2DFH9_9ACTN